MKLLLFFLSVSALCFYVWVHPTARHVAILRRCAWGCAATLTALWLWPEGLGAVAGALVLYLLLWLLGRFLLWPLQAVAQLLRR